MKIEATILLKQLELTISELVPLIEKLKEATVQEMTNTVELADIAFATREANKHVDEFKRRVNELHKKAATQCSITMAITGLSTVRTNYCTATSNPKPWYKIPYKRENNPEKYDQIMRGIGIDPQGVAVQKDCVRIHAPGLMDYCAEVIGEGGQPPAGIDSKQMTAMELNLRLTKKR